MSDEQKCVAGCMPFSGGETKHHKHCPHYPESLSKMLDDLRGENRALQLECDGKDIAITRVKQLLREISKVLEG